MEDKRFGLTHIYAGCWRITKHHSFLANSVEVERWTGRLFMNLHGISFIVTGKE